MFINYAFKLLEFSACHTFHYMTKTCFRIKAIISFFLKNMLPTSVQVIVFL